jgi:alanyl-tRNA synthetase
MTEKLFYRDPYLKETKAKILEVKPLGGERVALLLDRTIFYPEGGGQPSDRGIVEGGGFRVLIDRVTGRDEIWHEGKLEGGTPNEGEEVRLVLDWKWRYENMRNHTGQHILSAVIKGLYGAETTGFQIFGEYNKIEIYYPGELTWDMIGEIEEKTNEAIWGDLPVEVEVYQELPEELRETLRKNVSQKVKPPIRIVRIGDLDVTPCGGTHVRSTREVGFLKILRFYRKSRKLWRIEFVAGKRALNALNSLLEDYWKGLYMMPRKDRPLSERIRELKEELSSLETKEDSLRKELWEWKGRALLGKAREIGGVKVVAHLESAPLKDAQAFAVNFVEKNPGTVLVLAGKNYLILAKDRNVEGLSMRELLNKVLSEVGGGGGGSDNLARGGWFREKPEDVLKVVLNALEDLLGQVSR